MKKLKSEILETNITKLILLSMALTITMVAVISSASAAAPEPNYGSGITVDGSYSDWDLTNDYFADMIRAGGQGGQTTVESKLYLRYDCTNQVMYALVLVEPGVKAIESADDAWIAIDEDESDGASSSNKVTFTQFSWVYEAGVPIGYEASFSLPLEDQTDKTGIYYIFAHIQVDDGGSQTSATDRDGTLLEISCPGLSNVASIGDFVWEDLNRNGIQDSGEMRIQGVTVNLYTCDGTLIASTTTDSSGLYLFSDLMPGSYYVEFVLPPEYAFSPLDQGSDDEKDSDADTATGKTTCTELVSEEQDLTWDAGMYKLVEELTVSKTAETSYIRTHNWDIDKFVTTENGYMEDGVPKIWLYTDGAGDEQATWTVDVTYGGSVDSDFDVSGVITIENTGDLPATITSIEDVLGETGIPVTVSGIELPYTLPAGETLELSYSKAVDSMIDGSNDVTVTTERDNYEASAEIIWSETPTTENYKTINVEDISDLFGEQTLGTVTAPDNAQFTYSKDFAWADYGKDAGGDYVYNNEATIVETEQSDVATLKVNVQSYMYETAYAKGEGAECFIPTFTNWGWTNLISPGTYEMDLWAGAAQCDTSKGTNVGTVTVVYGSDGYVTVTYNVGAPYLLEETHVYAGYDMFPTDKKGKPTVAPGAYSNGSPFNGDPVYVIAHSVVGIPDPNFGPE